MSEEYDAFHDIVDEPGGVVSGQELLRVRHQLTKDGLAVEVRCQSCGQTHVVTVDWPELVALSTGTSPDVAFSHATQFRNSAYRWIYDNGYWVPFNMRCRCTADVKLGLSRHDVMSALRNATDGGQINQAWVQQVSQLCMQARVGAR